MAKTSMVAKQKKDHQSLKCRNILAVRSAVVHTLFFVNLSSVGFAFES